MSIEEVNMKYEVIYRFLGQAQTMALSALTICNLKISIDVVLYHTYEPRPTKWHVYHAKAHISLGIRSM